MPRISEESKQRNKEQLLMLIHRHHGLREAEMTELLSIERRTANNYLNDLEHEGKIYKEGLLWFASEHANTWLRRFELAADEAFTLYLAARQFVKQTDKQNPMAISALSRLAEVLKSDIPVGDQIFAAAQELRKRKKESTYETIFTTIVKAYLLRHPLHLTYRTAQDQEVQTVLHTYLIEPSAIGFTLYLIGHSSHVNALRSYKIERIIAAAPDYSQTYIIPPDFPGLDILRHAWSIMLGEKTERVTLRFSSRAKRRVLETNWHPSQGYEEEADGRLRWWVDVADTTDMKPWIRGWGHDVEVLEPENLREEIKIHVQKSVQLYQLASPNNDLNARLLRLWGKTTKNPDLFHPALYHMLDVAHVAQQLLSSRASSRWRQVLANALNSKAETLPEWLPYLIALHDIGKLSVPFQILNDKQWERLRTEGFEFGRVQKGDIRDLHHTIVGRLLLPDDLTTTWPAYLRTAFLEMVSGHHGLYEAESPTHTQKLAFIKEAEEWTTLRQQAVRLLQSYLLQQWPDPLPEPINVSAAIVALNGFCILCDWLGSDASYFQPKPSIPLTEYVLHSRQKAYQRVKSAGFFQKATSHAPTTFAGLFNFSPRPLQTEIDHIPDETLAHPTLTIIEAPTGEGKTEAALALARRIAVLRGTDEMYIALPTTATSNAMYERIQEHLEKRLGLPPQLVHLIHGQSFLQVDDLPVDPLVNEIGEEIPSLEWFAPKKVALLAPFGVGTVDQAELAALNVRHNALRLIGLAGKVVILDEVHAYDTYMTTIIKRMLAWLAALGSSVILLSATLPQTKRRELAAAFAGDDVPDLTDLSAYPSLLTIGKSCYMPNQPIAVDPLNHKVLHLASLPYTDEQAEEKARWLLAQVQNGGCACWITNTVGRAQAIFAVLEAAASPDTDLTLLHARFPLEDRQKIENTIRSKYGKGQTRPVKGIVVGTQVLEQSLDLDFDVMATDLAPIDLLLQRAGRLHRHERDQNSRFSHIEPRLFINMEMGRSDKGIYSEYILQKTKQALELCQDNQISLPQDYRSLVEAVYDPTPPQHGTPLYKAWDDLDAKAVELEDNANLRLANEPDPDYPFYRSAKLQGFKEDEESNAWAVAQTRWGQESITVIPLMLVGEMAVPVLAADQTPVTLQQKASRPDQLRLLQRGIRVSNHDLVEYFKAEQKKNPKLFRESTLLKHTVPLWLKPHDEKAEVFVNIDLNKPMYLHRIRGLVFGNYEEGKTNESESLNRNSLNETK